MIKEIKTKVLNNKKEIVTGIVVGTVAKGIIELVKKIKK